MIFLGGDSKGEGSEGVCFWREVFLFPQPVGFSELYSAYFLVPGLAMGSAFTHGVPKVPIR